MGNRRRGAFGVRRLAGAFDGNLPTPHNLNTNNGSGCYVTNFYFDLTECQSCQNNGNVCDVQPTIGSVDIRMSLGPTRVLVGQAFLQVKSEVPAPALGTPQSLHCDFIRPELQRITDANGWVRQVAALDRIMDIVTNSASSYTVNFYDWTNQIGQTMVCICSPAAPFGPSRSSWSTPTPITCA